MKKLFSVVLFIVTLNSDAFSQSENREIKVGQVFYLKLPEHFVREFDGLIGNVDFQFRNTKKSINYNSKSTRGFVFSHSKQNFKMLEKPVSNLSDLKAIKIKGLAEQGIEMNQVKTNSDGYRNFLILEGWDKNKSVFYFLGLGETPSAFYVIFSFEEFSNNEPSWENPNPENSPDLNFFKDCEQMLYTLRD